MRLLEVNGISLIGAAHQEAVNVLREAGNLMQIVVCKGYDKSSLIHPSGSGSFNRSTLSSRTSETESDYSQSISSLDPDMTAIDDSLPVIVVRVFAVIYYSFHVCHFLR